MGLSVADFDRLTPEEFNAIVDAGQQRERDAWERARTVAAIVVQPHVRRRLTPHQLLPLPWDKETAASTTHEAPAVSRQEARRRFEQLKALRDRRNDGSIA